MVNLEVNKRYIQKLVRLLKNNLKVAEKECADATHSGNEFLAGFYSGRMMRDGYYLELFQYMLKHDGLKW